MVMAQMSISLQRSLQDTETMEETIILLVIVPTSGVLQKPEVRMHTI